MFETRCGAQWLSALLIPNALIYSSLFSTMGSSATVLAVHCTVKDNVGLQGLRATQIRLEDRPLIGMSLSSGGVIGQLSSSEERPELEVL